MKGLVEFTHVYGQVIIFYVGIILLDLTLLNMTATHVLETIGGFILTLNLYYSITPHSHMSTCTVNKYVP